jgi:hypothetical protein
MENQMEIHKSTNKFQLLLLKAKIKGLAQEGIRFQRLIAKAVGDKKQVLRQKKKHLGEFSRYYLIAYALLRNIPYNSVEPTSNKETLKNPFLFSFNELQRVIHQHCSYPAIWDITFLKSLILKD